MTKRQHDFCIAYVACRNPREACITVGYTETYSRTKSYALLKSPAIQDKIATLTETYYKTQFQDLSLVSVKKLGAILNNDEDRSTQLRAIKMIFQLARVIDRHGDVEKVESETIFKLLIPSEYKQFRNEEIR